MNDTEPYNVFQALDILSIEYVVLGNDKSGSFSFFNSITEADFRSLSFVAEGRKDAFNLINSSSAKIVLCDESDLNESQVNELRSSQKLIVFVSRPKLIITKLINYLFISKENGFVSPNAQIHPTALVDPTAIILDDVTVSENCAVGPNTKIHTGARILPNVSLGKNVELHSNAVIGVEGFGYIRDNDNSLSNFPHIGGVLIEDNVVIGANTCVCKGALSNTIIGQGTKIDNLVHIAHNVKIGKDSMIAAGAILCGSCIIGDNVWIGPNATIRDGVTVGNNASVSIGSMVAKNVNPTEVVTGYLAQPNNLFIKRYLALFRKK